MSLNNDKIFDPWAISDFRGKFKQGSIGDLLLRITNIDGEPVDPSYIICEIKGPIENTSQIDTVKEGTPYKVETGFYVFEWNIPDDQYIGKYKAIWSYEVNDESRETIQEFIISEEVDAPVFYNPRVIALRQALEHHIKCAQNIPIYKEEARKTINNKRLSFTFPRWNQTSGIYLYRNDRIVNNKVRVNYFDGEVEFMEDLLEQDIIKADYNFRWFSDEELTRFLGNAVQTINTFPPVSRYNLENVPDIHVPAVLYGAAKDALRQLMMCLQFQQPAAIFGSEDRASSAFSNFETLKQNYESDWEKLVEQKKYGPYPKSMGIVTPTYTLPGGRCLSLYNEGICKIGDSVVELTLKEIYELFNSNTEMQILSQNDLNKEIVFSPISHIWMSGEKDVYEIKTVKGYEVRASSEHLFYINGKYVPVMYIEKGDEVVIHNSSDRVESDRIKSIVKLRRKEIMCDLEINDTANLFVNGIKCHNSRWFRMLFK